MTRRKSRFRRLAGMRAIAVLAAFLLVLAACGDDDEPAATTAAPAPSPTTAAPSQPDEPTPGPAPTDPPAATDAPAPPDEPAEPQILRIGMGSDAQSLDPPNFVLSGDFTRDALIYDRLLTIDNDGVFQPALATEWSQPNDVTYEFKLRQGVKFHDGTEFNAAVVKFVIERGKDQEQGSAFLGIVETVEVVDDFTVRMVLSEPFSPFLNNLAVVVSSIYSPTSVQGSGDDANFSPIGSGPYRFVSWDPDARLVLEKNPDYWGSAPTLDRVEFIPIPEAGTRVAALKSGEVDVIENPPPDQVQAMRDADDLYPVIEPKARPVFFGFNLTVVTDVRVRRAIAHAIDKAVLVEAILEGIGEPATQGLIPPNVFQNDPPIDIAYDPVEGKRLVDEAGAAGTEIRIVLPQARYLRDQAMAEAIQSQLAAIGINLVLDVRETGAWYGALLERDTEAYWLGWGMSGGDPTDIFTRVFTGGAVNNMSLLADAELDAWAAEVVTLPFDSARRSKLIWDLQNKLVVEDVVVIPIFYMANLFAARSYVKEFHTTTSELIDLSRTTIEGS